MTMKQSFQFAAVGHLRSSFALSLGGGTHEIKQDFKKFKEERLGSIFARIIFNFFSIVIYTPNCSNIVIEKSKKQKAKTKSQIGIN